METVLSLANLVLLLVNQVKFSDVAELSGWFDGEAELLQEKEKDNPRLRSAMHTLRRFSFRLPGYEPSESSDAGYSYDESQEELIAIPERTEDLIAEGSHSKLMGVA